MRYETINPTMASERMNGIGWTYLDVRTVEEYEAGHVPGAYNIPLLFRGSQGMEPNPRFLELVAQHFPRDQMLIVGCKVGGRSAHACEALAAEGWSSLANMDGGFSGRRDQLGRLVEQGWEGCGLPTTVEANPGRTYADLGG